MGASRPNNSVALATATTWTTIVPSFASSPDAEQSGNIFRRFQGAILHNPDASASVEFRFRVSDGTTHYQFLIITVEPEKTVMLVQDEFSMTLRSNQTVEVWVDSSPTEDPVVIPRYEDF